MNERKPVDNIVILYVEDEQDDIFFMRRAFETEGLAECFRCAADGGEAISYLQGAEPYIDREAHPLPHLILLDLNLPIRSGFEVLKWIRNQEHTRNIPVIIFSSSGHNADKDQANKLGASAYLLKPSSGLDFRHTVRLLKRDWLDQAAIPSD